MQLFYSFLLLNGEDTDHGLELKTERLANMTTKVDCLVEARRVTKVGQLSARQAMISREAKGQKPPRAARLLHHDMDRWN